MPIITPDTSEMLDMSPIPEGTYAARIAEVTFQNAKSSGNPMIVPKFDITVNGKVRPRKAYLVITGEGAYGLDQLLRATGFTEYADKLKAGSKEQFDTDRLVGQELNVVVTQETRKDTGELTDRIKTFMKK